MGKKLRRVGLAVIAVVLSVVLIAVITIAVVSRAPLPQVDGRIDVPGLGGDVTIHRDGQGVPHIYATTDHDLFFAQGYIHAQERFFQMDMRRHITAGRLSELVGASGVEPDTLIRTFGWRKVAEKEWTHLSEEARAIYTAYTEGVNAYIADKSPNDLANEYAVLGIQAPLKPIEPWTPVDSLVWFKAMAMSLNGAGYPEDLRMKALTALGSPEAVQALYPPEDQQKTRPVIAEAEGSNLRPRAEYPLGTPRPIPTFQAGQSGASAHSGSAQSGANTRPQSAAMTLSAPPSSPETKASDDVRRLIDQVAPMGHGQGIGSNSFVVAGKHSTSGKPIIANDPHLGLSQPSTWLQVGLHCTTQNETCTFDVSGFSFAGLPGVIIGRNQDIAWGFTDIEDDVADIVVEKNLGNGTYERDGKALTYATRQETIAIAGQSEKTITIKESVHGPIVTDLLAKKEDYASMPGLPDDYDLAVEWTVLKPDTTGEAVLALNRARNPQEIAKAAEYFASPAQNILFATTSGDIGYQMPGRIPIRPTKSPADGNATRAHSADNLGADGRWPRPGWDSSYDWQGYYAPSDLPAALNPPSGIIVPANQSVTDVGLGPFIGIYSGLVHRPAQIRTELERLTAAGPINPDQAAQVMMLDRSSQADELQSALGAVELTDPRHRELQTLLNSWYKAGAHTSTDQAGAALMGGLFSHLAAEATKDELGENAVYDGYVLGNLLRQPDHILWDDTSTPEKENADDIMRRAYAKADADLTAQMGADFTQWRWGRIHQETPAHDIFGQPGIPGPIADYFNGERREVPGGVDIPNANTYDPTVDESGRVNYEVIHGAALRLVHDMANTDHAQWVVNTGVSGHPLSPHYGDQVEYWVSGRLYPWALSPTAVQQAATSTLVLAPPKTP
ncbi:MAG: penicillin acylase family protein [Actinomycetaceae bacterium]|nr:penicillin acylase family protein [Actinomycetaceae bacterium]